MSVFYGPVQFTVGILLYTDFILQENVLEHKEKCMDVHKRSNLLCFACAYIENYI